MAAVIPLGSDAAATVSWRRFAVLVAILIAVPLCFWPSAQSLAVLWLDTSRSSYSHGFLVLAVCGWLVWRARAALNAPDTLPQGLSRWVLLAIVLLLSVCWQLAYRAGIQLAAEVLLLPLAWFGVFAVLGRNAAFALIVPLGYLVFALTLWDFANPALQWLSVYATRLMLRVVGLPSFFQGNVVEIPSGSFAIEGGCSGLHFMIVGLAIATLMGELRRDDWRHRLRWVLIAAALAIVTNWLRVFSLIVIGHVTHMQSYLVRVSHLGYGWALFAVALLILFLIERRTPLSSPSPRAAVRLAGVGPDFTRGSLAMVAVAFALPLMLNRVIEARLASAAPLPSFEVHAPTGWVEAPLDTRWQPIQRFPDLEERRHFMRDGHSAVLYRAIYREQRVGKKVGGYGNQLAGAAGVAEYAVARQAGHEFGAMKLDQDGQQSLLWFTYRVAGREFSDPVRAQLWYSLNASFTARSPPTTVLALWAPCAEDCASARTAFEQFIGKGGDPW